MTRFIATSALVAVVYVAAVCGQDILLGGWKSGGAAKQQSAASAASASNRPEPGKRTDSGDDYLASSPMLSLALNLDRCKSSSSRDCSTGNSVFSPLSIASTLTMLLTGKQMLKSNSSPVYSSLQSNDQCHSEWVLRYLFGSAGTQMQTCLRISHFKYFF